MLKTVLFIGIMLPWLLLAQVPTQTVFGKVLDKDTRMPLSGAQITLSDTDPPRNTYSDSTGGFSLKEVPVGRHDLRFDYPGYETISLQQIEISSGKERELTIELSEKVTSLEQVSITARRKDRPINDMATVSARTFSVEETQRYAASFNDPARMAVSFAGVSTSNDASNEIIVRGNSARGMLWRVEGIEIPAPNHFSNGEGGSGGGISILSSQIIGNSDFFTGAFPAEYGNALSGVFDIRFRKGNTEKREYAVQLGILGLQTSLEGPFTKNHKGSYLINYRYSTLIFLNAIGLPVVDNALVPQFQDISFHFNFPTQRAGTFSVWGLGGLSSAGEIAQKDSLNWEKRSDRFEDHNLQQLGATGLTHTYRFPNNKSYLRSVIALSGSSNQYRLDSLDNNYVPDTAYLERFHYSFARFNTFLNHKFNSRHLLRAGVIYSQYYYSLLSKGLQLETGENATFIDEKGNTGLLQSYAQWKFKISPLLDMNSGFHQSYFLLNGSSAIEPRWSLQYRFTERQALNLGAGLHSRIEPISVYLTRNYSTSGTVIQPNKDLGLTRSVHAVAGHDLSIGKHARLKSEVYYQHLYHVPVDTSFGQKESILNLSSGLTRASYSSNGYGRNYGMELTLERFFREHYFFMLTGSIFQSEYTVDGTIWYSTRFNGKYMLNALGGYEFLFGKNKKNSLSLNSRLIWRGGNRYTEIDTTTSLQTGYEVLKKDDPFSQKVPDYWRWDISSRISFNFPEWTFSIAIEIQNVTNRLNVNRYFYDPYTKEVRQALMFGIMPVFNFKAEF